ncbi:MAG: peptide deformylase [Syntrophales bacterium]|nr:peptide deformylase [Syntrophales bacterium]
MTLWNGNAINEEEARVLRTSCVDVPAPMNAGGKRDIETLIAAFISRDDALGLAAPQIGISKRIIVFRNKGLDDKSTRIKSEEDYEVMINPRITQCRGDLVYMAEGCLSCPDIQVEVGRFPEIKVRAFDINGRKINRRYNDFLARIVQHELDHLDGKLIVDHEGALSYPKKRSAFFEKLFQHY